MNIKLAIMAFKEMIKVFKDLKIPIDPKKLRFFAKIPMVILLLIIKKGLASKGAEIGIFGHAHSASGKSEMKSLAIEFTELLKKSSLPTPIWDKMLERIKEQK